MVVGLPPLVPASWWPPCSGVGRGSGLWVDGPQHGIARDGVHPCLVALACAFEPQENTQVHPNRGHQLDRLVERACSCDLPKVARQWQDVSLVDPAVRHGLPAPYARPAGPPVSGGRIGQGRPRS